MKRALAALTVAGVMGWTAYWFLALYECGVTVRQGADAVVGGMIKIAVGECDE